MKLRLTGDQILEILKGAVHEAAYHREMARGVHDLDKVNKFTAIREGYLDAIALIRAQEKAGKFRFDKSLMSLNR